VNDRETTTGPSEITAVAAAVRAGDESTFSALAERHRRELLVHCYRMLGSFQDAEDAVQDALLRAWRYRESLKDGAPLRPWLYRVATNSCFDAIARDPRRSALAARTASDAPEGTAPGPSEVPWLQPFPDARLESARAKLEAYGFVFRSLEHRTSSLSNAIPAEDKYKRGRIDRGGRLTAI